MKTIHLLELAYLTLLKIEHNECRVHLDRTYCILRDQISKFSGRDAQDIQVEFEARALQEKKENVFVSIQLPKR